MKQLHKRSLAGLALVTFLAPTPSFAQRGGWISGSNLRDSHEVRAAFQSVVAASDAATVRVVSGGKDVALGTVVGSEGWIITKYSELRDPVICRFTNGRQLHAQVVGYDPDYDLAMLKVDATGLKTVDWANDEHGPAVGQLVATASPGDLPIAVGVISVPERKIPAHSGWLGIHFGDGNNAQILRVLSGSPAEQAGLKADDILLELNEQKVADSAQFVDLIHRLRPGDQVHLLVKRGDDQLKFAATLKRAEDVGVVSRNDRMNEMGGALSYRSFSFPKVIQHDTVLRPADCGGPLVDLSGKVVGINIARAGRTESYAVPADNVRKLLADLENGHLAPPEPLPGTKETKSTSTSSPDDKKDDKKTDDKKTAS
ncbi:MAG TPA: trypsin-like peptidase domain-containing protein [Pirellulales bacterium]|jgi:serine protease Do|nr:trypsin-like peptidase domain-containing protein [Pirellulales bacterium]